MKVENEYIFTEYTVATLADAVRFGIEYNPFNHADVGFDARVLPSNVNPLSIHEGKVQFVDDKYEGADSLVFIFNIREGVDTEKAMVAIGAWTHGLGLDGDKIHIAHRTLGDYEGTKERAFIYRIYLNTEGQCFEHPEMLKGTPCGMYHCPVCMEMVIAGLRHPSDAEIKSMYTEIESEQSEESPEGWTTEKVSEEEFDAVMKGKGKDDSVS